jgi:hypothetical protein
MQKLFGFILFSCALFGQTPNAGDADRAFLQAISKASRPALEQFLDPDFTWTGFDGKTQTKGQILQSMPKSAIENQDSAEQEHYAYGDVFVAQSNLGLAHSLRVWVKRGPNSTSTWNILVYQEVMSLEAPATFAPGAGKDCQNPCKSIPYQPKNETERQVAAAYSKLETAAMAHNSPVFATMVGDEFAAASSNSNKLYDKRGRMDDFDHAKNAGVAPTPLISAQMLDFGNAVVMRSEHIPDRGRPLHVTRVWVKRDGSWVETLSYQTSVRQ